MEQSTGELLRKVSILKFFGFSFVITFFELPLLDNDVLLFFYLLRISVLYIFRENDWFQLDFIIHKYTIGHNIFSHSLPLVVLFLPSLFFSPYFHVCDYMPSKRLSRYFMSFFFIIILFRVFFLIYCLPPQTILIIHSLNL